MSLPCKLFSCRLLCAFLSNQMHQTTVKAANCHKTLPSLLSPICLFFVPDQKQLLQLSSQIQYWQKKPNNYSKEKFLYYNLRTMLIPFWIRSTHETSVRRNFHLFGLWKCVKFAFFFVWKNIICILSLVCMVGWLLLLLLILFINYTFCFDFSCVWIQYDTKRLIGYANMSEIK